MTSARFPVVGFLAIILAVLACNAPSGAVTQPATGGREEPTAVIQLTPKATTHSLPSVTQLATEEPLPAGATPTVATLSPDCTLDSDFVADVTIPDRTPMKPGSTFTKTWRLRNSGTCPWDGSFQFTQITGGMLIADPGTVPMPDVPPGDEVDISMTLTLSSGAPIGTEQTARFQMRAPDGRLFGTKPYALVAVSSGSGSGASISGTVWADHCTHEVDYHSEGCVPSDVHGYQADGIWNHGEPPIGGVLVTLRSGNCSGGVVATDITDASGPSEGMYSFANLAAGTYCVAIDALDPTNEKVLIPGGWTYPANGTAETIVTIQANQYLAGVNFGWDYQFD
ncbi:MAG: hypothetical protein JXB30_02365 [Anaerolineae bacterium]|nr:hypothetical protein [Anaerolineae bacterium]